MRANDPPTLARVCACASRCALCAERERALVHRRPPFVTKAHALRVCAPPHSAGFFRFPLGASTRAREEGCTAPVANA